MPLRPLIADVAESLFADPERQTKVAVPKGKVALHKGSQIAPGICANIQRHAGHPTLANAIQLPKHGAMFLKYVLSLVDGAIERVGFVKENIKIISIGAGLLKVGMTPKTHDHKMSVTLGLLSASERQIKNQSGEETSQALHGRCSGPRDDRDPYWAARGDDMPPRLVVSGYLKDQLTTYKKIQAYTMQAAKQRVQAGGGVGSILEAMSNLDFQGFGDLPSGTQLFKAGKRPQQDDANSMTVRSVKYQSTGREAWCASRRAGFLFEGTETNARIKKFGELAEEFPDLFETTNPAFRMPTWGNTIWKKWDPSFPHYRAKVVDAQVMQQAQGDARLFYTIRYDTDDKGVVLIDDDDKYVQDNVVLDPDMYEWSYEDPNTAPMSD